MSKLTNLIRKTINKDTNEQLKSIAQEQKKIMRNIARISSNIAAPLPSTAFGNVQKVYKALQDNISRDLFWGVLQFRLNDDLTHLMRVLIKHKKDDKENLTELLKRNMGGTKKDKIVLCASTDSWRMPSLQLRYLKNLNINIDAFCKINEGKLQEQALKSLDDITQIQIKDIEMKYKTGYKFIAAAFSDKTKEIKEFLLNIGINPQEIYDNYPVEVGINQYFEKDIVKVSENEVFIDGGSFNAQTAIQFIKYCDNKYEHIYSFEPASKNADICQERLKNFRKATFVKAGLWSKKTQLSFSSEENANARVDEKGDFTIETVALDEYLDGKPATFIKLDLEGAELEALKGMANTIRTYHPKLAISLYHKPCDILDLPSFILDLSSDYKFYIRHYTQGYAETVLYAV